MKETKHILEQESLKQAPFTVPEGYFQTVEDRVRERIAKPERGARIWMVLKPGIAVAAMFLLIFGIGYATLSLTGTLGGGRSQLAEAESVSAVEEVLDEAIGAVPDEELLEYIADTVSWSDLQSFIAENLQ